ncbi:MAG TPA: ferritin-like domain-containing protein [Microbacterium sp.]|nr:ferritin-like domain-containing protein [Microbacterium sp.]
MTSSPTFEIRTRAELVDALSVAAQVEHVVLLEYLYAAFSCRSTFDTTVPTATQLTSWRLGRELYLIAHDEMEHLGIVLQLLAALGAPPVADAWPLPIGMDEDAQEGVRSVAQSLLPFGCELTRIDLPTIERFIRTESPQLPDDRAATAFAPPDRIRFDVLGQLYRAILRGIELVGDDGFAGVGVTGVDPSPLTFSRDGFRVATIRDATASLTVVINQGEGASDDDRISHWSRFKDMRGQLLELGTDAGRVAWPSVSNPVVRADPPLGTTLLTAPMSIAIADLANRTYRALWLLLGGTYIYDWSAADSDDVLDRRRRRQIASMRCARWLMATGVRPLGEILARLPAFAGQPDGPTAGITFEQYGEFRVPPQPDARMDITATELNEIATDLAAVATDLAADDRSAGARLARVGSSVELIRRHFLDEIPPPRKPRFEPPSAGRWLRLDFSGWYQVRLATGGDPFDDPRGISGWQFALPGEPDLDRVLRFQPEGTFLRSHIDPQVHVGVSVDAAHLDGQPVDAFAGGLVDLLDRPIFEGHNGVVAADGDEPIVPMHLLVRGDGWELRREASDAYRVPYDDLVALGQFPDEPAAVELRIRYGVQSSPTDLEASIKARLQAAGRRLQEGAAQARKTGDEDAASLLDLRRSLLGNPSWPFGAVVGWRLRLVGSGPTARLPDSLEVGSDDPWWLELISTGFDPDAACALVRGILHVPVGATLGPPSWGFAFSKAPARASGEMPVDAMGVRPGR